MSEKAFKKQPRLPQRGEARIHDTEPKERTALNMRRALSLFPRKDFYRFPLPFGLAFFFGLGAAQPAFFLGFPGAFPGAPPPGEGFLFPESPAPLPALRGPAGRTRQCLP